MRQQSAPSSMCSGARAWWMGDGAEGAAASRDTWLWLCICRGGAGPHGLPRGLAKLGSREMPGSPEVRFSDVRVNIPSSVFFGTSL